jgi:bacillolysin
MKAHCIRLSAVIVLAGFTALVHAQGLPPGVPGEEIVSRDSRGVPTFVRGALGVLGHGDRGAAAVQLLREITGRTFGGTGTEDFVVVRQQQDELGQVHIRAQQRLRGLPVVGGVLIVHADTKTGAVHLVNGNFAPDLGLPRVPSVEAGEAIESALREAGIGSWEVLDRPSLTYVIGPDDAAYLAWVALVSYTGEEGLEIDRVFADATDGSLVVRHPQIHRARNRRTYTAEHSSALPGILLITEGGSSSDPAAQAAHDNAGTTYDYYLARHGRDSLNNAGMTITTTIDYIHPDSNTPNNAYWRNSQIACGNGDGSSYGPFCSGLDILAHEYTHGVTEHTSELGYLNEPGALNEAMSDIFGAATEAWARGLGANTWKIGEDVRTPGTPGDAFRYMDNPAQGGSRDYYPDRYIGQADGGGVHVNSGIANLAFYLLVQGGQHPRGLSPWVVTGIGMLKAERIFYRAQTLLLGPNSDFEDMRAATAQAARDLYGAADEASVHMAWCAVGVPGCPDYDGVHEVANCRAISGWAMDWEDEGKITAVDIYDGSTRRATTLANRCGYAAGCHGFHYTPSTAFKNGQTHTVYVRHANTSLDLYSTPRTIICKVGVFTSQTPAEVLDATGGPWSVGNDITPSINGYITHLRYYKAAGEDGTHTLKLWRLGGGSPLATGSVNFGTGLPAGWVTADIIDTAVTANTTYRVSVTTYSKQTKTSCGFSTPVINGPVKATGGAWSQGDGVYPGTNSCGNYWTDVYFDQ